MEHRTGTPIEKWDEVNGNAETIKDIPCIAKWILNHWTTREGVPFHLGASARGKAGLGLQVGPVLAYSPGRSW